YSVMKQVVRSNSTLPIHLLMNRSPDVKAGRQQIQRFEKVVQHFLKTNITSGSVLINDQAVTTAVMQQHPYVLSQPKSAISQVMARLVKTYLKDNKLEIEVKNVSFVDKLK